MAMVNMNNLLNMKDSRWLQLEVCREFQRNKCSRPDTECKFAHPPVNVEVQNGRVTACYDSIKGRCNREKPPCKYFHPPLHLKDQLLINGRNHLALKNALMQQMGMGPGQGVVPGQVPAVATNPYLGVTNSYNPYFPTGPLVSLVSDPSGAQVMSPLGVPQQAVIQQKETQSTSGSLTSRDLDRQYSKAGNWQDPSLLQFCGPFMFCSTGRGLLPCPGTPELPASPDSTSRPNAQPPLPSYPGMVTYKRPAEKGGVPVYPQANSASAAAYQHLMQLQQPFVPVSSSSIQQQLQHHHQQIHHAAATSPVHATTSTSPDTNGPQADTTDLLDGPVLKKLKAETDEGGVHGGGHDDAANGVGSGNGEGLDEESKDEGSALVKRLRASAGGTPPQATLNNNSNSASGAATAVMVQNSNAAYAAAAQNYHSAIAAMTYTGASLQANNKAPQGALQNTAQASIQSQLQYPSAAAIQQQQQQNQQQQLIQQYQAMAAAAFASQAGFQAQGNSAAAAAANQLTGQQLSSGLPFAVNPYLAALPQLAAAQRAQMLQQQSAAGAFGQVQSLAGAGGAAFNPFGLQLGAATGLTAANIQQFQQSQQQQQQAILAAAYGQFARAPVPVVSAAPSLTQQLYIGNPVAQGAAGSLQAAVGVKRMRPG